MIKIVNVIYRLIMVFIHLKDDIIFLRKKLVFMTAATEINEFE
jgi:hypothetical protein